MVFYHSFSSDGRTDEHRGIKVHVSATSAELDVDCAGQSISHAKRTLLHSLIKIKPQQNGGDDYGYRESTIQC